MKKKQKINGKRVKLVAKKHPIPWRIKIIIYKRMIIQVKPS